MNKLDLGKNLAKLAGWDCLDLGRILYHFYISQSVGVNIVAFSKQHKFFAQQHVLL